MDGRRGVMDGAARRLVVIGAGISGLAAAWAAAERARAARRRIAILVLEREPEAGGKARSLADGAGWLVEGGPTACFEGEPAVERLVEAAGLSAERVTADPAAARRFLVRGGRMREVHPRPLAFARSGLLSPAGLVRLAAEPWIPARDPASGDESVWSFARRRLGREAADRLIAPMVLGVHAGDARRLSLAAAFPRLAALEREHGSLIRGMIALRASREKAMGGRRLFSFQAGLQSLPLALAARGEFELRTRCEARRIAPEPGGGGGWRVELAGGEAPLRADAVVLAGEPWAAEALLREAAPAVARELAAIPCPPVVVAALGFRAADAPRVPRGFGALVPRGEPYRILGCLWDSHLFPARSPGGHLLVRAMLGGAVDPAAGELDDREIAAQVRRDLARLLGIEAAPVFERIVRWPRAIPQYELGHRDRVAAIARGLESLPGLYLAGNGTHGISFDKAAARGWSCGESAAEALLAAERREAAA